MFFFLLLTFSFDMYKMNGLKVAYGQYSVVYVKNISDKNLMPSFHNILFSFVFALYKMNRLKVAYGQYSVVYVKKRE